MHKVYTIINLKEIKGDLTQSDVKNPYTNRNVKWAKPGHQKHDQKVIQRLRTDLGWSVGVTTATKL